MSQFTVAYLVQHVSRRDKKGDKNKVCARPGDVIVHRNGYAELRHGGRPTHFVEITPTANQLAEMQYGSDEVPA